ncbi:hypothetical protein LTR37_007546 [Vermiconidia calcicola]|uniref:Uncharacterized protein n=1 Tax=Vermiconidia calcicola TaxID=1690605 RepID=A0ACC3NDB2_9PEZI|nr:hypothetical protein LTR37_007546 [Vermiconidia calcicola]
MPHDLGRAHSEAEVLTVAAPERALRPFTTDEKLAATNVDIESRGSSSTRVIEYNSTPVRQDNGVLSRLRNLEAAMDRKLGIESQAIDRKRAEDRSPVSWHSQLVMGLLWASGTMNVSCFATGFLGHDFGLSLKQSILIIVFASILGGAVSGFCATLGAATGLRQISVGRYSMGWYPNKLIALLNTIQQLGWSAVGCITGGLALQGVSNGHVSVVVGIIIIAVCSLAVSFVGLRAILVYEKYAWLVYFIIFMIIFGQTGQYTDNKTRASWTGPTLSGYILSLFAIVYGSSASWATIASDYYVHYPADVSRVKVFLLTTIGISIPTSIGMTSGAVVAFGMNNRIDWAKAYERGLGFLIKEMLYPNRFADFILVLLVLSGINMNIINTYSAAISCQQFARPFARVPRFLWTFACFGVIIALALAGRNELLAYLQNFLALLGYWCTSYFVIVFSEHYYFRKGNFRNYNLEGWNDPKVLPMGLAAGTAFALGVIAWVMGMWQTWYTGPVSALIGKAGGDVSNQFTLVVTTVSYIPLRHLELKYIGR